MKQLADEFDISLIDSTINLENFSYVPEYSPVLDSSAVTSSDIDKAIKNLDQENDRMHEAKSLRDVICPNCGEEFQISDR